MRLRRVLVVGQAPSAETVGLPPLSGRSGGRMAALLGGDFRERMRVVNLLGFWPGRRGGKGDRFPHYEAAFRARLLRPGAHRAVLLLGRGVARCFGAAGWPFLEWRRLGSAPAAVVPHPSGVSHWWNDPGNRAAARAFLGRVAEGRMPA